MRPAIRIVGGLRRRLRVAVLLSLVAACSALPPVADRETLIVSVVGTNDVHGGVLERNGLGGLALFGGYVANLRRARAKDGGAVLLIDAGDMWQGTLESNLFEGQPVVAAYNVLGYTAAAVGNHEFDFGPVGPDATPRAATDDPRGALKARAAEADFPLLAANLIDSARAAPVDWTNVRPSAIVEAAGVRVGIVGVMTREALRTTSAANTKGLDVADLALTIEGEARRLRIQGAGVIIVAAHAGGECTRFDDPLDLSSCDNDSEIFAVARALPPGLVDVIVGGHKHKGIAHEVNGIPVISSWSGGGYFGRVDITIDTATGTVSGHTIHAPRHICRRVGASNGECIVADAVQPAVPARYEGREVRPDPRIEAVLAPAVAAAEALKTEKLGPYLEAPIVKSPDPESPLGNLLTEILFESDPDADLAIHNTVGGIRANLPAGELTFGSVYEMFPFDNRVVKLSLSGAELKAVLRNQLVGSPRRGNVGGVRVRARCRDGTLRIAVFDRANREVQDNDHLVVLTTDFLATGGDDVLTPAIPGGGFRIDGDGPLLRDVIVNWMRQHPGPLQADRTINTDQPRWDYPHPAPVRCGAG